MKVERACAPAPASARLSLQAMRLSYLKKQRFYPLIPEKYNVPTCKSVAYQSYFANKCFRAVCALRNL